MILLVIQKASNNRPEFASFRGRRSWELVDLPANVCAENRPALLVTSQKGREQNTLKNTSTPALLPRVTIASRQSPRTRQCCDWWAERRGSPWQLRPALTAQWRAGLPSSRLFVPEFGSKGIISSPPETLMRLINERERDKCTKLIPKSLTALCVT